MPRVGKLLNLATLGVALACAAWALGRQSEGPSIAVGDATVSDFGPFSNTINKTSNTNHFKFGRSKGARLRLHSAKRSMDVTCEKAEGDATDKLLSEVTLSGDVHMVVTGKSSEKTSSAGQKATVDGSTAHYVAAENLLHVSGEVILHDDDPGIERTFYATGSSADLRLSPQGSHGDPLRSGDLDGPVTIKIDGMRKDKDNGDKKVPYHLNTTSDHASFDYAARTLTLTGHVKIKTDDPSVGPMAGIRDMVFDFNPDGSIAGTHGTGDEPGIMTFTPGSDIHNLRISACNLVKEYRGRRVVNDVSFELDQGEIVGLLGPNGAGKTTTFYMITGLVRPKEGSVRFDGQPVTNWPMHRRARAGVGYLPQEPSVFRKLSVEDNIRLVLELHGVKAAAIQKKIDELAEELHITRILKSVGNVLSGGERRRVEIARALATEPKFILLDEPFTGIDPVTIEEIQEIIFKLRKNGIGILITDHNVGATLRITDRNYILIDGKIIAQGTSLEIAADEHVRKHYLGQSFDRRIEDAYYRQGEVNGSGRSDEAQEPGIGEPYEERSEVKTD